MTLDQALRDTLVLPAVCAPMFLVSGPKLVAAACKAGVIGALPRQNARTLETFENWLRDIRTELDEFTDAESRRARRSRRGRTSPPGSTTTN